MKAKKTTPPKHARRFLNWFLRDDFAEEVQGDLDEQFHSKLETNSLFKARVNYWYQVINYLRPFAISKFNQTQLVHIGMIKHNIKVGYRNLARAKGLSSINIGGLTVGLLVAMLIGLWVHDELSFDRQNENIDRIAQVLQHQKYDGNISTQAAIPMPLHAALKSEYGSDFKYIVMSSWHYNSILSYQDKNILKNGGFMGENAPDLLSLKMLKGSKEGLKEPASIFLSSTTAEAIFGGIDPMNKQVRINNNLDVIVTGVYEDLPYNSTFANLMFIAPWELYLTSESWIVDALENPQWDNNSFQCFVQLADQSDMTTVSNKIERIKFDHVNEADKVFDARVFLHPMKDWHLRSNWNNGIQSGGMVQYVWLFGTIGIFVLVLACINFMNLSTAQSEKRSKEVGVRKSIGSLRGQLVGQFLSESFLVVILAFAFATLLVSVLLPSFNLSADKRIVFPWSSSYFWMISGGFVFLTGILSGWYPALYLSSFQAVKVLKGGFRAGGSPAMLRKVLVVVQFTVSIVLIVGTVAVVKQMHFSKERPLGYDSSKILMIEMNSPDQYGKYSLFRNELKNKNAIEEMAVSTSPLTEVYNENGGFDWEGKDPDFLPQFANVWVSHLFGKTIGWELVEGRDFSTELATDSLALIINETALVYMGIEDPIGKTVRWLSRDFTIIGVVRDILMESPFKSVKPTTYTINTSDGQVNFTLMKLNPEQSTSASIDVIKNVHKQYLPNVPFEFQFADDEHAKKFAAIERIGKLTAIFAGLAILISCLGLLGLAAFMAERRTKEIGIRKILGASILGVWKLLSKEFMLLITVSCIISVPLAYYALNSWLQNYEYRTNLHWWFFAIAIVAAVFITLATVSFQALKAAFMNPTESLRTE